MDEGRARWRDAALAAACLAVAGASLGGIRLRARPGPVRDFWLAQMRALAAPDAPWRRLPLHCSAARLLGGLDLSATLRAGKPVAARGVLAEAHRGILVLPMAERAPGALLGPLAAVLDDPTLSVEREGLAARHPCELVVLALDEGVDDEALDLRLRERLAFEVDLDPLALADLDEFPWTRRQMRAAAARYRDIRTSEDLLESLCRATVALGIDSPRAALLAARSARALAALADRGHPGSTEMPDQALLDTVLRLVLAPRATRLPAPPESQEPAADTEPRPPERAADDPSPPEPPPDSPTGPAPETGAADAEQSAGQARDDPERILKAARAVLPADLLARLAAGERPRGVSRAPGKSGAAQRHRLRGRPMGSRRGDPRHGARLDVLATLRAAAPWQPLREPPPEGARLRIESDDLRILRFRQRSQSVTVFVVDASGSSALYRLAEAKGAVERLLADCYVRRDEVALIAFRGQGAELLLPPTRSLVRAKRALAALPGGGGTPLAAAIEASADLLEHLERRGSSPLYVMLTDGRANVCRDGRTGREAAMEDARAAATGLRRRTRAAGMVIDTSPRPHRCAVQLAEALGALALPLPNADAAQLQAAVKRVAA